MTQLKLSKRLEAIARLVPRDGGIADVGTDHGYIPVWLAQYGHLGMRYAMDINEGPLEHAKLTANEYDLQDDICFYPSDGLDPIDGSNISTIIIAGMGG